MEMHKLGMQDKARAVDILARAFHDDPIMNWICPKPGFIPKMFELTLPVFLPHGLTYMAGEGKGVASWLGPGNKLEWPFSLANFWSMLRFSGVPSLYRFARSGMQTEKFHPRSPHYYLFAIGAPEEFRGQGIGTALITQVLRRCDAEGVPAYLENSKEANLAFYQGHGFEVQRKIQFARGAPPIWLMWREPRQASGG